jgi:hypothetical protein
MKKLFIIIVALMFMSCSRGNWYWSETRHSGIEKYHTLKPGWPRKSGCTTYYSSRPIKETTLRKYFFYRHGKN